MTDFFNGYRVPSARAQWWNYGWNAAYFVTICVHHHECVFGSVVNGIMMLSGAGTTAVEVWNMMPEKFPYIRLDEFVVMPNHIHGIVTIVKPGPEEQSFGRTKGITGENRMISDNLSKVIRWYKGRTTFEVRKRIPAFNWQTRFYDHIIRNEKSYQTIRDYILQNPQRWQEDKFYR